MRQNLDLIAVTVIVIAAGIGTWIAQGVHSLPEPRVEPAVNPRMDIVKPRIMEIRDESRRAVRQVGREIREEIVRHREEIRRHRAEFSHDLRQEAGNFRREAQCLREELQQFREHLRRDLRQAFRESRSVRFD